MPERMTRPAKVQEIRKPDRPVKEPPAPLTERPEMPLRPEPLQRPEPIEPEDVGPAPMPPEPYQPNRPPAEQRLQEMEQQTARGAVSSTESKAAISNKGFSARKLRVWCAQI